MNGKPLPVDNWDIAELVPHGPPMALLNKVTSATTTSLVASAVIDERSPFYVGQPSLPAWWAVEYLAQGVAALAGIRERAVGRDIPRGFLTSCRRFTTSAATIPFREEMQISVNEMIALDAGLAAFDCRMEGAGFESGALISVYQSSEIPGSGRGSGQVSGQGSEYEQ